MTQVEPPAPSIPGIGQQEQVAYYTNSFFLLRILDKASAAGNGAITARELIQKVLLNKIGKRQGIRVYDLEMNRDREIKSLGLKTDLSALEAMGLIMLEGDDVRITLTPKGRKMAESFKLPDKMEKVITELSFED